MVLPKDSFRARILQGKALGGLYFAHRASTCKRGRIISLARAIAIPAWKTGAIR
jgi:hypothetical protein